MAEVRYALYVDALQQFSHSSASKFLFLEQTQVFVQNSSDRGMRNAADVLENLILDSTVTVVAKTPLVGFKWTDRGVLRKFQVNLMSDAVYQSFVRAISVYVQVLPAGDEQTIQAVNTNSVGSSTKAATTLEHDWSSTTDKALTVTEPLLWPQQSGPRKPALMDNWANSNVFLPDPSTSVSQSCSAGSADRMSRSMKMPTPISKPSTVPGDNISRSVLQSTNISDADSISEQELEKLFTDFLRDDRNIVLCKAVERIWIKMGLTN